MNRKKPTINNNANISDKKELSHKNIFYLIFLFTTYKPPQGMFYHYHNRINDLDIINRSFKDTAFVWKTLLF